MAGSHVQLPCIFLSATECDDGSSMVFEAADFLVLPHSLLLSGSATFVNGQCDRSFWVFVKMKLRRKLCGFIFPKVLIRLTLNSCVDCKVRISVTSKALDIFSII